MDLGVADHGYVVTGRARGVGCATAEVLVVDGGMTGAIQDMP